MRERAIVVLAFFLLIGLSQRFIEPAYNGYLFAFGFLFGLFVAKRGVPLAGTAFRPTFVLLVLWIPLICVISLRNEPTLRDVSRDLGAILAFLVGRYTIIGFVGPGRQIDVLRSLSLLSVVVAAVTLATAVHAYVANASVYEWRGEYLPYAHSWVPYLLVVNYGLMHLDAERAQAYVWRCVLVLVASLAGLSRTDLLLEAFLLIGLFLFYWRSILLRPWNALRLMLFMIFGGIALFLFSGIDVVQQRVDTGSIEDDLSIGWRLMENVTFLDYLANADSLSLLFGSGFGARLALPAGVVDFNDNNSIPFLHNSYFTVALKFGLVGLIGLLAYVLRLITLLWPITHSAAHVVRLTGLLIIFVSLGKAITLQGLTEWSHVLFFGLGAMLLQAGVTRTNVLRTLPRTPPRQAAEQTSA